MTAVVQDALNAIRNVPAEKFAPISRPKLNTHMHLPPNFSAFETPQQAAELADAQDVRVIGLSNYYDWSVYGTFAAEARKRGIFPEFGLEIISLDTQLQSAGIKVNDPANPGKIYICGKGITKFSTLTSDADAILSKIRNADSSRMAAMIEQIEKFLIARGLSTGLTASKVIDIVVRRHGVARETVYLQERHVAQAFQIALFAFVPAEQRIEKLSAAFGAALKLKGADDDVGLQNEIRTHLMKVGKPGYVAETFVSFTEATTLIRELGGFVCYPLLADANNPMTEFEGNIDKLLASLRERNVHSVEFIPNRNSIAVMEKYTRALRAAGIIVTAGTEHNSLDLIPIEPVAKGGAELTAYLKDTFWEGACVIAAHQFLTLNGKPGYTDQTGNCVGGPERITELAALGAKVISAYIGK